MQERHVNFYSHILKKTIDLLISGHWGFPVLMFPTSMGNAFQNRDTGLLEAVGIQISNGLIKTYNIGSIDSETFYGKHLNAQEKILNYNLYTRFLVEELIPEIQKENDVHRIGLAGCSFGAYHAVNLACKYPDIADFVIGMSGSYDIKSFMNEYYDDTVYFNNPVDYMKNAESWKYNHMKIILGTSDWDICRNDTLQFSHILSEKNINHWYDEKQWANHDWPLWNMAFPEYLNKVKTQ
jgi:esterase/lipase superfamily enzyme